MESDKTLFHFQQAEKGDLPCIESIIQEAYESINKILSRPPGALENTANKILHSFRNNQLYVLYNEEYGLIGTFSLALTERKTVKMFHFAIKSQFQEQGVGSWVVEEVIKMIKQQMPDVSGIELEIYSKIPSHLNFYKKFGFIQIGRKEIRGEKILILKRQL